MTLFLLCLGMLGFVFYFYAIGIWYLGFLPLIFLGILLAYYGTREGLKYSSGTLLQKYSLGIARGIILCALLGIGNFFGLGLVTLCLSLIAVNLGLWIISYLISYTDGTTVFQRGYYVMMVFLWLVMTVFEGRTGCIHTFTLLRVLHFGVSAFFVFLVSLASPIPKYFHSLLSVLAIGTVGCVLLYLVPNPYIALSLFGALLTLLYTALLRYPKSIVHHGQGVTISVRRILAGERITEQKKFLPSRAGEIIAEIVGNMPIFAQRTLELMNIFLVCALMYHYLGNTIGFVGINHLFYWIVIVLFINNVLLLKRLNYNSIIQNLVIFLVINFALYVSLFSYFDGNIGALVSWAILWNIISASLLFYAHTLPILSKILSPKDYVYWILATVAAMIVNIILLFRTALAGELIFFLVLLYIGIEGMVLFYAIKYVQGRKGVLSTE